MLNKLECGLIRACKIYRYNIKIMLMRGGGGGGGGLGKKAWGYIGKYLVKLFLPLHTPHPHSFCIILSFSSLVLSFYFTNDGFSQNDKNG